MVRVEESLTIPMVPWNVIRSRLQRLWIVKDAPHHSIIGQTRSGKSYLTTRGILSTCQYDKVLYIDSKGDDPTTKSFGRPVRNFPSRLLRTTKQLMRDGEAQGNWFRLVLHDDEQRAAEQARNALEGVFREGKWIVVVDELRHLTDVRNPGLNLGPQWERIILRGGYKGVSLVSLTQEPRWVRGSFYTQSSFYWFSRVEDEAAHKRIAEVGTSRMLLQILPTIPRHHWIYTDSLEETRFWGMTKVA